ncbi:MAG: NADPH:quinone oxidoreductase family protein [Patulibacter sp.]
MRALRLREYGGPENLELAELPVPVPADDHVLVEVKAVGINFPDLLSVRGEYQYRPVPPFVPGCEIAGVVAQAPEGSRWSTGDRVSGFVWEGGYAEYVTAPPGALARLPDGATFADGAATVVNYHTVHFALARRGGLRSGETVLALGAGGGIGSAAVQVAKGLGARVIAGVAADDQVATARAAGADEVLVLREGFAAAVRELNDDRGVDVVLDPLGDWLFAEAVRALAPEGRILVVGFAAGEIPTIKVNRLLLRNVAVVGVAWGAFLDIDPSVMSTAAEALERMFAAGIVRPPVGDLLDFRDVPAALDRLGRGQIVGKAVAEL